MKQFVVLAMIAVGMLGCVPEKPAKKTAPAPSPNTMTNPHVTEAPAGGLDLDAMFATLPEGWTKAKPVSSMRLMQVSLEKAGGDTTNGELAVFHFPGTGGDAASNIKRWQSQFSGPKGEPGEQVAKTDTMMVGEIRVITVDISGTQLPGSMGVGPATAQPNSRMIASVLETSAGNWFIKISGPEKTMGAHEKKIREFMKTAKLKTAPTT